MIVKQIGTHAKKLFILLVSIMMLAISVHAQPEALAKSSYDHCTEAAKPGKCLYNLEASFKENYRIAFKLDSTDLRNPPMPGLAKALSVSALLSDLHVAAQMDKVMNAVHDTLLLRETRSNLCERIYLSVNKTSIVQHQNGKIDGQLSYNIIGNQKCYQRSKPGQLTFDFQILNDSISIKLPDLFSRYFRKNIEHKKPGQEVLRETQIFPNTAILATSYSTTQEQIPIVCMTCPESPNAVNFNLETGEISKPYGKDSMGLYGLLQQIDRDHFALEAIVLSKGEFMSDTGPVEYADLKILASEQRLLESGKIIRIRNNAQKNKRLRTDAYNYVQTGQVLFIILKRSNTQQIESFLTIDKFPSHEFVDCLPLAVVASDMSIWNTVRKQLHIKQIKPNSINTDLQIFHEKDASRIIIHLTPNIENGVSYDFQTETIIKYDTTLLGSNIVKNNKILNDNYERNIGDEFTLRFSTDATPGSLRLRIPQVQFYRVFSKLIEYRIDVKDATSNSISIRIIPANSKAIIFDSVLKSDWNASQKLATNTQLISLYIEAKKLQTGDVITFHQKGIIEPKSLTIKSDPKKKLALLDRVYPIKYSIGDTLIFSGINLLEKEMVIYVPCEIGDPEVPLRGYCNIQPWHQRGQVHSRSHLGYIVPDTYSHGMNRRTNLIPRSGQVWLKNQYGGIKPTELYIELEE